MATETLVPATTNVSTDNVSTEYCPEEVTDALTGIMRESLLLIRIAGNDGDADYCAVEANHIHNLPGILRRYSRAKLERYLTWARAEYALDFQRRFHCPPTMFLSPWQQLEAFLIRDEEQRGKS